MKDVKLYIIYNDIYLFNDPQIRHVSAERDGYFGTTVATMSELHFFDPHADYSVIERKLPHWAQAGVVCFLTWRTNDSLPRDVVQRWRDERHHWLRQYGINPRAADWRSQLGEIDPSLRQRFFAHFSTRWHDELDACHGACVLKDPVNAKAVADSLLYANGDLYELTDFVVMPNHIHLLATFSSEEAMLKQCQSWKHYTACRINRHIGNTGRFWQQDGFDHLVRSEAQFEHYRSYIDDNPRKARLAKGEYLYWSIPQSIHLAPPR